ncbi:MAG TPA: lytic transglycosylase domain-containing protein [Terriglobales bacterium]|nr:lytic transglycosylase domain-containing protein [Nitrospira sp.]HKT23776.1 lytic transglycosylase domain-containing protein [Terriglobales bacterium]
MKPLAKLILVIAILAAASAKTVQASEPEAGRECVAFYASAYGVPIELVDAVIQVESAWNPYAVSSKGAAGLMQLMPATAIRFGVRNRFDVEENVRGGVAYLAWLIRLFRGDLRLAVAAYYVGESAILLRGLAYSSEDVFRYVTRVAETYRRLRLEAEADSPTAAARVLAGGTQ